jgi:soluble lytic murein transglycosylase-like protein
MCELMVQRNIKLFAWLLTILFFMGLVGLSIGLVELNAKYESKQQVLGILSNQVLKLQFKLDTQQQKLAKYNFMEYKNRAFSKRYPQFSFILDTVYRKSLQYDFKPDLVLGVVHVESFYNPEAISHKGAYGLMQVNLAVWRDPLNIDENRIFDVEYNIDLGLKVLKHYYEETNGNLKLALHLYNNGYLYNNTSYTEKVDSAVTSIESQNINWHSLGF